MLIVVIVTLLGPICTIYSSNTSIYYKCHEDYCICCINSFGIDMYPQIPNSAQVIYDFTDTETSDPNKTLILNTKLKQIENTKHMFYRTCSNPDSFHTVPLNNSLQWIRKIDIGKPNCDDGIQKCLQMFCRNNMERLEASFTCLDENIRNLDTGYENGQCFSKIRYMSIESSNLVKIANGGFLANNRVDWNIVYLKLDFATDIPIEISCDAFQYLKKLRSLKLNIFQVTHFRCFFRFNPDLVKIEWQHIRIWNMCNDSLSIWIHGVQFNEKVDVNKEVLVHKSYLSYIYIYTFVIALFFLLFKIVKIWIEWMPNTPITHV